MLKTGDRKITYSRWLTLTIFLIVVIAGTISELFQAPTITSHDLDRYIYLFDQHYFDGVDKLVIKNSLVNFTLETNQQGKWAMTDPRHLPVADEAILALFSTLKEVKIKRTLPYDSINLTSYNLTTNTSEITFSTKGESTSVKIGLINPIDDSCYIAVEERDAIYQTNNFSSKIDSIDLTTLVDARVFDVSPKELTGLAVRVNRYTRRFTFDGEWKENNQKVRDATSNLLDELFLLQCQTILDVFEPSAKTVIDEYLQNPPIVITIDGDSEKQLFLSNVVNQIPGIKIEKNQNILAKLVSGQLCLINRKRIQFIDNFRNI